MTKKKTISPIALSAAMIIGICGCSGGGSSDSTTTPTPTPTPTPISGDLSVSAGYGRIVSPGSSVTLNAEIKNADSITWTQTDGAAVTLDDASIEDPSFTAPTVTQTETLVFEVTVSDGSGAEVTDEVLVEVWIGADSSSDPTVLGDFSTLSGWNCDVDPTATPNAGFSDSGAFLTFAGNGVPNHATGVFPNGGNPHTITEQSITYNVTTSPERTGTVQEMAEFGITIDGVKLERDTAERYNNQDGWSYEAITPGLAAGTFEWGWLGTDCSNAHVQPNGQYHYHGLMEGIINRAGERSSAPDDMVLGGYAADGFPFYLRYGYADPDDASSGLVVIEHSWELKSGTRGSGPGGVFDGTFREDWEFVDGTGDTDECGGRFGVTPEYPDGIYHYYVTDDYPYIPRCVWGAPDASFRAR